MAGELALNSVVEGLTTFSGLALICRRSAWIPTVPRDWPTSLKGAPPMPLPAKKSSSRGHLAAPPAPCASCVSTCSSNGRSTRDVSEPPRKTRSANSAGSTGDVAAR